jgi:hypothetical protein
MINQPADDLGSTSRLQEVYAGILVLGAALVMGYLATREAITELRGSSATPPHTVAIATGILAGIGGGYFGLRLLLGWHRDRALLPLAFLFCGGVGALAGAVWVITLDHGPDNSPQIGFLFGAVGITALILWWRRVYKRR